LAVVVVIAVVVVVEFAVLHVAAATEHIHLPN